MSIVWFLFFKQKTAYEMRISDWSSDVCSSDLRGAPIALARNAPIAQPPDGGALAPAFGFGAGDDRRLGVINAQAIEKTGIHELSGAGIGFVADRSEERRVGKVCQYV